MTRQNQWTSSPPALRVRLSRRQRRSSSLVVADMVHLSRLRTHRQRPRSVCGTPRASVGFRLDSGRRKRSWPCEGAEEYLHRGSRGSYKSSKATRPCEGAGKKPSPQLLWAVRGGHSVRESQPGRSSCRRYRRFRGRHLGRRLLDSIDLYWPCEGAEEYLHRSFCGSYKSIKAMWPCEGAKEYLHRGSRGSYKSSKAILPCEGGGGIPPPQLLRHVQVQQSDFAL